MQKPKFRTADKSAWVFVTTRLRPQKAHKMDRRTALRCGYIATASALTGQAENTLPTPANGESMASFRKRLRAPARKQ